MSKQGISTNGGQIRSMLSLGCYIPSLIFTVFLRIAGCHYYFRASSNKKSLRKLVIVKSLFYYECIMPWTKLFHEEAFREIKLLESLLVEHFCLWRMVNSLSEAYSEPCEISKIEIFMKIIYGFQSLNNVTKISI